MADNITDNADLAEKGAVVVFSRDLFFGMRIRTVLRQLGFQVVLTKDAGDFNSKMAEVPVLGIVDFNVAVDWSELAPAITADVPVIAFGAHTDVDGFRAAKEAGVARVTSNGEFSRSLPELAGKYAKQG